VVVILLLIAVTLGVFIMNKPKQERVVMVDVDQPQRLVSQEPIKVELKVDEQNKEEFVKKVLQLNVSKVAEDFAERFGSYSNDSNHRNIDDLASIMTDKMKTSVVRLTKKDIIKKSYYGMTTRAINSRVESLSDKDASVIVVAQRQETKEGNAQKIFYQEARVALIKNASSWMVDNLTWQ